MEAVIKYLEDELKSGNNWAAFEGGDLPDHRFGIHCFTSSIEAETFCSENLFTRDPEDGDLIDLNYGYHSIQNLLSEFGGHRVTPHNMLTSPKNIDDQLKTAGIESRYAWEQEDNCIQLAYGRVLPVRRKVSFIPEPIISAYHIVRHHHQYMGMIYELGHSSRILESFDKKEEAMAAFNRIAADIPPDEKHCRTELWLVAAYNGMQLHLDMEGPPMYNTGLVIAGAGHNHGILKINQVCDPLQTVTVEQRFFIQYDQTAKQLLMLNDRLEKINLQGIRSYWSSGCQSVMGEELLHASKLFYGTGAPAQAQKNIKRNWPQKVKARMRGKGY